MLFSSVAFLFYFLPAVLGLYFLPSSLRLRNGILLGASLFFYIWGEGSLVLLLVASTLLTYLLGLAIERCQSSSKQKALLFLGIGLLLGALIHYKYFAFILKNASWLNLLWEVDYAQGLESHLPIGISFFTFEFIAYLVDVYRRKISAERNPTHLFLYAALFPHLIAGPIIRYGEIVGSFRERRHGLSEVVSGLERFFWGLVKKVLLADSLAPIVESLWSAPSPSSAWLGTIAYTLQIYVDFSAYSDMAIGLGAVFGFRFPENFSFPYSSKSLAEFWRRWHMSLSQWFRDYLYIPLGGSRGSQLRTASNLILVFTLCGLWHGAAWAFLAWGTFHGVAICAERFVYGPFLNVWGGRIQNIVTMLLVMLGWVLFRSENLGEATSHYASLFLLSPGAREQVFVSPVLANPIHVFVLILLATILASERTSTEIKKYLRRDRPGGLLVNRLALSVLVICAFARIAEGTYIPFIYFRF